MSGWAIVALVGIVIWGIVQSVKARAGIISDEDGNETYIGQDRTSEAERAQHKAEIDGARAEIEDLRERIQVLERIATDTNTMDARERARIASEIEALRLPSKDPALSAKETAKD